MIKPSQANFKADYDKYVAKATILIHTQSTSDAILEILDGNKPVEAVANAAVMVIQRLDSAARNAGIEVQDTVKIFGAKVVVDLIVELGNVAGKFKMDDDLAELALSVAVQDYVKSEISAGRINGQKLKVAIESDIRKLPPKIRKEIQQSQQRIQMTARKYNGGQPQPAPQNTKQGGLLASAKGA